MNTLLSTKFNPAFLDTIGAQLINAESVHRTSQAALIRGQLKRSDVTLTVAGRIAKQFAEYMLFEKIHYVAMQREAGEVKGGKFPDSMKTTSQIVNNLARDYFKKPLSIKLRFSSVTYNQLNLWLAKGAKSSDMPKIDVDLVTIEAPIPADMKPNTANVPNSAKGGQPMVQGSLGVESIAAVRESAIESLSTRDIVAELLRRADGKADKVKAMVAKELLTLMNLDDDQQHPKTATK